ncbi:hypothetical protein ACROYT_G007505 [Oculina patagonica]
MSNNSFLNISTEYFDDSYVECPEEETYTSQKRLTRTALYLVAMIISLFGNVTVIWIVRKNQRMRNLTHYLIVNMAVADLLITVLHMPYKLQVQLTNSPAVAVGGLTGKLICKVVGYSQDVSIASSVLTLMGISIDRFMAVVFPLKRATLNHKARYFLVPIWIVSIVVCSPLLYVNKMEEFEGEFYCFEEWNPLLDSETAGRDYTVMQFVLFYILPLVVITVLYSCIVFKVWNRHVPGQRHLPRARPYSVARKKLLRMLIIIVCLFAACWLPYHVIYFLQFFSEKYFYCLIPETIMFYCLFVGHANSAINPCIYFAIHKEYRKGLFQVMRSVCCLRAAKAMSDCLLRRKNSFNLQVNVDLVEQTDSPTSYLGMLNKKLYLESENQVVITSASRVCSENAL